MPKVRIEIECDSIEEAQQFLRTGTIASPASLSASPAATQQPSSNTGPSTVFVGGNVSGASPPASAQNASPSTLSQAATTSNSSSPASGPTRQDLALALKTKLESGTTIGALQPMLSKYYTVGDKRPGLGSIDPKDYAAVIAELRA